jgi:hypothetical protein
MLPPYRGRDWLAYTYDSRPKSDQVGRLPGGKSRKGMAFSTSKPPNITRIEINGARMGAWTDTAALARGFSNAATPEWMAT